LGVLKEWMQWILKEWKKTLSFNEFSKIKEILLNDDEISKFNVWDDVNLDNLEWIEEVELTSYSKWKWFSWAMKRHNFAWWLKTHGSKFHRALWSIGNRKLRRTHINKKMHWHMWNIKINLKNVSVEILNKELSVFGVKWPVPGARNSLIVVKF
jgi:large subunit ribosomal protein L3